MIATNERMESDPWLGTEELPPVPDDDDLDLDIDVEPDITNPPDCDAPDTMDLWVVIDMGDDKEDSAPDHVTAAPSADTTLEAEALAHLAAESSDAYEQQFGTAVDLFAKMPIPSLSRRLLPDVIADYAFDQAELVGVIPAMIAFPCLAVAASAIDDGIVLQPKRHDTAWKESARIWVALVADPSARKSPSIGRAVGIVKKRNAELSEAYQKDLAKYEIQLSAWKEVKKQAVKNCEEPAPAPEKPPQRRTYVEDTTIEKMGELLMDNPRGLLYYKDELTGWFGGMDAYRSSNGSKDRADWLEAYNGGSKNIDRVIRGSLYVPNWGVSMLGGIQPGPVRQLASKSEDDGLMQRFMMIVGSNSGKSQDRPPKTGTVHAYKDLIQSLFAIQPSSDSVVLLSEGAADVRDHVEHFCSTLQDYESFPSQLRSHIGKWDGLWARLTLIYHVIDCAGKNIYPSAAPVKRETAEKVFKLLKSFILPNAMAFYCYILGDNAVSEHVKGVASHILAHGIEELSNRDLVRNRRGWKKLSEWERMNILNYLQDSGWILPKEETMLGRKLISKWAVNPAVHRLFAERAIEEAERRKEVVQIIRDEAKMM